MTDKIETLPLTEAISYYTSEVAAATKPPVDRARLKELAALKARLDDRIEREGRREE
jgi:hypothetical protein